MISPRVRLHGDSEAALRLTKKSSISNHIEDRESYTRKRRLSTSADKIYTEVKIRLQTNFF